MRQQQYRLFGVIHRIGRQARLVIQDQRDAILARNVYGRYDDEFVPIHTQVKRNLFDFAAGHAAAHRRAVKHAGQNHVVDIARCSGDFVPALFARHRGPDDVTFLQAISLPSSPSNQINLSSARNRFTGILRAKDRDRRRLYMALQAALRANPPILQMGSVRRREPSRPQLAPSRLSREFAICKYAVSAKVSCLDHAAKFSPR